MQLKKYQQTVLNEIRKYAGNVRILNHPNPANFAFYEQTNKPYNNVPELGNAPFVCVKVPTGGGKTLIATHAVGALFYDYFPERNDRGLVMWFVPSDAIKKQTLKNLKDRKHPFRQALDERFDNKTEVFDLKQALAIKKEDIADNVCIIVTTLSAFKREDKEWLKVFKNNGTLMDHFEHLPKARIDFLHKDKDGEIVYSLANVIRLHNPLVIVDEGHNVQTELSFAMLKELNPAFVLEFTATPKGKSNVLVDIPAQSLKDEKMIKMPLYLANKIPWQDTIVAGMEKLKELEKAAKKNKDYIRPIMLIQAEQELENEKKVYVSKVKDFLINDLKVPEKEISIKTSKTDDLPDAQTLLSKECPVKYIITVNALREGWDCPFAYILVSVSNLGARLSVEQTIGRIMRLPYVKEHTNPILNYGYIFASTHNFSETSEMVIKSLQSNGYEDIIAVNNEIIIRPSVFKKVIKDNDIHIPLISIKDGKNFRTLSYEGDLVGEKNIFDRADTHIDLEFTQDNTIEKLDIEKGELIHTKTGQLALIHHYKNDNREELLSWLARKISRKFVSIDEMSGFLEKTVDQLLKKHRISTLSISRFQLKEAFEKKIDDIVESVAKKHFDKIEKAGMLCAKADFPFDKEIELLNPCRDSFLKHLYEKAGHMNGEELVLARSIDDLDQVAWWLRNPEKEGFYIQGWKQYRFYPDFIVKTKSGNYYVIEYKGEQLIGNEDTEYKTKIGELWTGLAGKRYNFKLVEKNGIASIIKELNS
jgi:superfamily II DNA or RNA helicase